jgi:hypothetical protein
MHKKGVKYFDTTIKAAISANEIVSMIVEYGGTRTSIDWDEEGNPSGIAFIAPDPKLGLVPIQLRANVDAVHKRLLQLHPYSLRRKGTRTEYEKGLRDQAHRIIWRHLKDLIEQQLLAVYIGQFSLTDTFMQGVVVSDERGQPVTIGELVASRSVFKLLGAGGSS